MQRAREDGFAAVADAAEWDARSRERHGAMWSGRPNGRLVAEVAGLDPGTALDVGCGEGADAIWLARGGWRLTAVDISEVALNRARREHLKAQGTDPAEYVDAGDLRRLLGDAFTIERDVVEPRLDPPPGTPHVADVALRARRR
jgi:2-polyprenyl-3-methyl-5-hydroxy-6-metoxy-1,4-benzoquinol methylase